MEKLLKRITDFVKTRSESEQGEWAKVSKGDVQELSIIFSEIIKAKYEGDMDESLPIEFRIIDRTKYERLQFFAVPYEHHAKSTDERLEILSLLGVNAKMATSAVDSHIKIMQMIRRQEKE